MCGIAGILVDSTRSEPVSLDGLRNMAAVLQHRGPDGYGLFRDARVGLAHTRLSIIDLLGGDQPIRNEDGSIWIAFNGEIFNYVELRAELESHGHRFYTRTDTEVIVHAYEQWDDQAWSRFNGQFAIALWDGRQRNLWLVRDPLGILPLFYARAGPRLMFGSEAKAIFASGHLQPELDGEGIAQVFSRWAATAPTTVFANVRSVLPGTAIRFDQSLEHLVQTWWQPDFSEDPRLARLTADDATDELEALLSTAVNLRLRADVPVGAYLSGGLDSSVIASLIQTSETSPLQTFAIRFEESEFDETEEQRRMAAILGNEHHEIYCRSSDIATALPDVVWQCEAPLLRTAPVPLFLLSDLVRSNGMKVVLTGEGADEFFAGYNIFKEDKVRRFWSRQPDSAWRPGLLSRLYDFVNDGQPQQGRMWQEFFRRGLTKTDDLFYSHRIRWENTRWAMRFLSPGFRDDAENKREQCSDPWLGELFPADWHTWSHLSRAQLIEIVTFMSSYLLCSQGDRVAMGHGVEVRYPFLDPAAIAFAGRLPARLKLRGLQDKFLLRRMASRRLPPDIWRRPKKPYRAPTTTALFGEDAPEYVGELLSDKTMRQYGVIAPDASGMLIRKARERRGRMSGEREEMALIGLLTLQVLVRCFFEQFRDRVSKARRRLAEMPLTVLEDHVATGKMAPETADRSLPGKTRPIPVGTNPRPRCVSAEPPATRHST